jgi:membrane protein implicated in regulation of membrane protease activity
MAHWPRTVPGKTFYLSSIAVVVSLAAWFLITASWYVLVGLAVVALVSVALYAWRRRVDATREREWVGEFSFGDVVDRMRAREALDRPRVSRQVVGVR